MVTVESAELHTYSMPSDSATNLEGTMVAVFLLFLYLILKGSHGASISSSSSIAVVLPIYIISSCPLYLKEMRFFDAVYLTLAPIVSLKSAPAEAYAMPLSESRAGCFERSASSPSMI